MINDDILNDIDIENADLIISNPPYIKTSDLANLQDEVKKEPQMALDGGNDGLDFYRIINTDWTSKLKSNGVLMLEIGEDQGKDIVDALTEFNNVEVKKDMYGNDRMVVAKR
ncbi:MAG: N5-glutamine methyltransferase family protein [Eubacterium sp.]|uniref:N5-glutamine methyltransferase family protein n=1 Tax=Eubacterium sp. TaxID=142586 RepID=UPI00399EFB16